MTGKVPAPKGPYSPWVRAGGFIFVSGQIPLDVSSGEVFTGGIQQQTAMVLDNLALVLEDAGAAMGDVVKTTVFLTDMGDFEQMNEIYAERFSSVRPARSTVQAARLPLGISVEIEAVAVDPRSGTEVVRLGEE